MGSGTGSRTYKYGGGTGATDTPGAKKLIQAGGGGNVKLYPPENSSNDLQTKYGRIGFETLYGGDNVQNAVLGSYADQLARLDRRFGAIKGSDKPEVIITNESGSTLAAVGFNPQNPADQTLYINAKKLGKIKKAVATTKESTASGWAAANKGDLKANAYYAVTHEYGHMLHNQMFAKAKANGYTGTRNEFVARCNAEILNIAKQRYGVKRKTQVSVYGNTNGRERFAETFASSQLGGNTAMAKAMRYWLKQQGF